MTPQARDLFALASPRPLTGEQLHGLAEPAIPFPLTQEDKNRLAAIQEEVFTEGRQHRHQDPVNPHD